MVLVGDKKKSGKYSGEDMEKVEKKVGGEFGKGMEMSKIGKGYWVEEGKVIGKKDEMEGDGKDRVKDMVEVLVEDLEEKKE